MFLRVMVWKEWREQLLPAIVLTSLGLLFLAVLFPMLGEDIDTSTMEPFAAVVFAWACGMVAGAVSLANEFETQTQAFLDQLPRRRLQVWSCKAGVAAAVVVLEGVLLAVASSAARADLRNIGPSGLIAVTVVGGLYGLACGLLGSAVSRTVLAGIGWAVVTLFATAFLAIVVGTVATEIAVSSFEIPMRDAAPMLYAAWVLVIPIPMTASAAIYGKVDRQRRYESRRIELPSLRYAPAGIGLRSSLWLSLRQGWPIMAGTFIAAVVAAPFVLSDPILVWIAANLVVGIVMGVSTLGDEQFYGAFKFLADQRLPLGRFWLFKVGLRFVVTAGILMAFAFVAGIALSFARQVNPDALIRFRYGFDAIAIRQAGTWVSLTIWGLTGFAFGHIAAMMARKSFVAVAIAVAIAVPALAIWLPSLLSGGLPAWVMFVLPLGAILLARMSLWAWATDQLLAKRVLRWWVLGGVLAGVFVAGMLQYRIREVPSAATPFDVAEFESGFVTRDQNPVRSRLVQAEERFRVFMNADGRMLSKLTQLESSATAGITSRLREDRVLLTLVHGWPVDDAAERGIAEMAAKGGWLTPWREAAAAPPFPADDPRDEPFAAPSLTMRVRPMATWVGFLALHEQSQGRHVEALDLIESLLTVARRVQTRASRVTLSNGLAMELVALQVLRHWGNHPKTPTALLPRAIALTQQNDKDRPEYADTVRSEYLRVREQLGSVIDKMFRGTRGEPRWRQLLPQMAEQAPWEKRRRQRLIDGYFTILMDTASADYPATVAQLRYVWKNGSYVADADNLWMPSTANAPQAETLAECIKGDLLLRFLFLNSLDRDRARFLCHCESRATLIGLALRLYQRQHGTSVEKLDALVPEILPSLPLDPFSGRPFQYRLVAKEEVVSWAEEMGHNSLDDWGGYSMPAMPAMPAMPNDEIAQRLTFVPLAPGMRAATHRRLSPGTGVLWSIGPDGNDQGGNTQSIGEAPGNPPSLRFTPGDLMYLIPATPR